MEPEHALAQHVDAAASAGPPAGHVRVAGAVAECGQVVAERVPPDVDHLARIPGHRDAPAPRAAGGPGDREVGQAAADEGQHLVAAPGGLDPEPASGDLVVQQPGIPRKPEEPVLLADPLRSRAVLRAAAAGELGRGVELLAADAVEPLVVLTVQ